MAHNMTTVLRDECAEVYQMRIGHTTIIGASGVQICCCVSR